MGMGVKQNEGSFRMQMKVSRYNAWLANFETVYEWGVKVSKKKWHRNWWEDPLGEIKKKLKKCKRVRGKKKNMMKPKKKKRARGPYGKETGERTLRKKNEAK